MSKFNLATNHPLIPNSNEYFNEQKYVSIHSEDRNILKYPSSAEFEIELPEDYLNVQSVSLSSWSFPSNYNVFSDLNTNRQMSFKLISLYNPEEHPGASLPIVQDIYDILSVNLDHEYIITIQEGFYTPDEMASELQSKFNTAVNLFLSQTNSDLMDAYDAFKIIYNNVEQRLWFGNERDQFDMINDSIIFGKNTFLETRCVRKNVLPQFINWGLPSFLGFTRSSESAIAPSYNSKLSDTDKSNLFSNLSPYLTFNQNIIIVPRIYSSDIDFYKDDVHHLNSKPGMWLLPDSRLPDSEVFFLKAPMKINLMGYAYFYMELAGLNCLDETSPFNESNFTATTNQTNGVVNSAFAKISIPTTPISQWYDDSAPTYKWFNPPAERIRKLKVKLRYHDGQLVEMGNFEYSFMILFNLFRPQIERTTKQFTS